MSIGYRVELDLTDLFVIPDAERVVVDFYRPSPKWST